MEKVQKELVGTVVSACNNKTITVRVETYKKHPKYGKRVKYSKKYRAHDENNIAKEGDTVRIAMTRPLSKTKRYELVEIVKEAIKNAKDNAKANNVKNIEFVVGNASEQIVKWKKLGLQIDAVIVDPPRKGLDTIFMDTINEMDIKKILYISCDPATLARDMKYLTNLGYTPNYVQPVDMFPHTVHVETVVLLSNERNLNK